jgi:hypothetical protein
MDIAHSVALLNAHAGVLDAEIARIDADVAAVQNVNERYSGSSSLLHSTRAAEQGLGRLRAMKRQQLGEVRQQLELFRLHLPGAKQLLAQLAATQKVELPSSSFPPPTSTVNAVVNSQILSPTASAPTLQPGTVTTGAAGRRVPSLSPQRAPLGTQTTIVTPARPHAL